MFILSIFLSIGSYLLELILKVTIFLFIVSFLMHLIDAIIKEVALPKRFKKQIKHTLSISSLVIPLTFVGIKQLNYLKDMFISKTATEVIITSNTNICNAKEYENFLFKKITYNESTVCLTNDYSINLSYWEEIMPLLKQKCESLPIFVPAHVNVCEPQIRSEIITKIIYEPLVCNCSTNNSSILNSSTVINDCNSVNSVTEALQITNFSADSLKTMASVYNDNMSFVIFAAVAVVVGYGIWCYFYKKAGMQTIQIDVPTVLKENIEIKTQISNDIVDLAAEPLTNLVENEIFDNLFLDMLQDLSLEDFVHQLTDREILLEILKKVNISIDKANEVIIHTAPVITEATNTVINFPPIS